MPISCTTSQYNELFWDGSHCLKSLVICDSRFESQIVIAIKSRDLEHLGPWDEPGLGVPQKKDALSLSLFSFRKHRGLAFPRQTLKTLKITSKTCNKCLFVLVEKRKHMNKMPRTFQGNPETSFRLCVFIFGVLLFAPKFQHSLCCKSGEATGEMSLFFVFWSAFRSQCCHFLTFLVTFGLSPPFSSYFCFQASGQAQTNQTIREPMRENWDEHELRGSCRKHQGQAALDEGWPFMKSDLSGQAIAHRHFPDSPGRGKNWSRCNFQSFHSLRKENRVSLVRIHFLHPESDAKSADVGVGGPIGILSFGQSTATFCRFARIEKIPIFEALGQIRANRVSLRFALTFA